MADRQYWTGFGSNSTFGWGLSWFATEAEALAYALSGKGGDLGDGVYVVAERTVKVERLTGEVEA